MLTMHIVRIVTLYNHWSEFNVHGYVNRNNILIHIQQDATLHSLIFIGPCIVIIF